LLLLGITSVVIIHKHNNHKLIDSTSTTKPQEINLAPPTKDDAQRVSDNKQKIVDENNANNTDTNNSKNKAVTPVITYADQYGSTVEVGAYVPGIFEDNGVCTAVFTQNSESIKKSVTAVKDVNSVDCPTMSIASSEFKSKGQWNVVVHYQSINAEGNSISKGIGIK
jgi:hypothetical protein